MAATLNPPAVMPFPGGGALRPAIRVKAYGLIEFTKAGYLKVQAVVFTITFLLLGFALWWRPTGAWAASPIFANLAWFVLLILVLEAGETAVMLGKFRSREKAWKSPPGQF
jgi:acyl-CoA synthetase (AMP-forming)/AMP-acid ligase II